MGHHPTSAVWVDRGGANTFVPKKLTDEQCEFLDANIGISRRTLRHVHVMFNERFKTDLDWHEFMKVRWEAIREGRCKTTYLKHYYKHENSSERELRLQRPILKSRITGGCQYKCEHAKAACGAPTLGRYCEQHAHAAYAESQAPKRSISYIDSSLGKYG